MMGYTDRVRNTGEIRALRDEEWLRLHEAGRSTAELAEESGVSVQLLRRALSRARKERDSRMRASLDDSTIVDDGLTTDTPAVRTPWWLELVPLFHVGPFTPTSPCPHHGPIREGSLLCCMVCSTSGMDDHPALTRDPATDPPPESDSRGSRRPNGTKSPVAPDEVETMPETRRQRRSRIFGPGSTAVEGAEKARASQ